MVVDISDSIRIVLVAPYSALLLSKDCVHGRHRGRQKTLLGLSVNVNVVNLNCFGARQKAGS